MISDSKHDVDEPLAYLDAAPTPSPAKYPSPPLISRDGTREDDLVNKPSLPIWRIIICVAILFANYFLAQYDKFILSYFQSDVTNSLGLSLSEYGILSGYATGIVYALCAIPVAYLADYTGHRVLDLVRLGGVVELILLARIGMGIGQAPVEALSVSLISDMVGKEWVFLNESLLYVGVYVGEAISAQIATAFLKTGTPWNVAMKAIGVTGVVVAVLVRLIIREPPRQISLIMEISHETQGNPSETLPIGLARQNLLRTLNYVMRMRSFWLLTIAASFRQLSGNVFGYYMPGYLLALYPEEKNVLSNYGIIVGAVGSFAVVTGGLVASLLWKRTVMTPLYMTAIGGMISSVFVILMVFSKSVAGNDEGKGTSVLYGVMSLAYLTAETWLGAFNSLLVLLLPPQFKTFGLAIYMAVLVLIYSSGPQIMALALRGLDSTSEGYVKRVRLVLAILIPLGYWLAGIGFLFCVRQVRRELNGEIVPEGQMSRRRKWTFGAFATFITVVVIVLFTTSLVYR